MGKYMKKAKPKGELALLDSTNTTTSTTTYFGVRTRAKTLALQNSNPQPDISPSSGSYLQLRSRRLHKPPISKHSSKRSKTQNPKSSIPNSIRVASQHSHQENTSNQNLDAEEASFGENVLDFEGRKRSTRESTPCNLIRDPDTVRTPGSTTRPTSSTEVHRRTEHAASRRQIPTAREMDEFFAKNEENQQKQFIEKYNFDPVKEKPLPGRYEWEKLKS